MPSKLSTNDAADDIKRFHSPKQTLLPLDILFIIFSFSANRVKEVQTIEILCKSIFQAIHNPANEETQLNLWKSVKCLSKGNTLKVPPKFQNKYKQMRYAATVSKDPIKMLVCGYTPQAGKSCLVLRYLDSRFYENYDPPLEDIFFKNGSFCGDSVQVEIHDSRSYVEFMALRECTFKASEAAAIVCSATDSRSVEDVVACMEDLERFKDIDIRTFPVVVLINKVDVPSAQQMLSIQTLRDRISHMARIPTLLNPSPEEQLQTKTPAIPVIEVSAKADQNVSAAFTALYIEYSKWARKNEPWKANVPKAKANPKCVVQ